MTMRNENTEELLLTPGEAAGQLRISERSLWTLTKLGKITAVRLGSRVFYDPNDLRDAIERAKTSATA